MKLEELYSIYSAHPVVITDSRNAEKGAIFFALKGEKYDGNVFARQALDKGCAYAVVSDPSLADDDRFILVEDTLKTLQDLAGYHRQQLDIPVLAITGTNGKTTTKELIVAVLSKKFRVTGTQGNFNNHIGLPLTLLSADKTTEVLVTEMGANHPGEIAFLCDLADPTHGLITNIGKAHLEGFGSFENILRTKSELYDYLRKRGGVVFYNYDNDLLKERAGKVRSRVSYGTDEKADISFRPLKEGKMLTFVWKAPGGERVVRTHLYGGYNLENAMAAVAVGVGFGVPPEDIVDAVSSYVPGNMRSQVIRTKRRNTVVLDAYNANPASMRSAIEEFVLLEGGKKAVILGDMLELGKYAEDEHEKILELLKEKGMEENVYLAGENFFRLSGRYGYKGFEVTTALKAFLEKNRLEGYTILVKGSRLMRLEELLDEL